MKYIINYSKKLNNLYLKHKQIHKEILIKRDTRDKSVQDRNKFLEDNNDVQVSQNVRLNTVNRRTMLILWLTLFLESILSYAGISFFLDAVVGITGKGIMWVLAFLFSSTVIFISIWLRARAADKNEHDIFEFNFRTLSSYFWVFLIPISNLIIIIASDYATEVFILNLFLILITIIFHIRIINEFSIFETAAISLKAKREIKKHDQEIKRNDEKLEATVLKFDSIKENMERYANNLLEKIQQFRLMSPDSEIALPMPNGLIWLLNQRIYYNEELPYLTTKDPETNERRILLSREPGSYIDHNYVNDWDNSNVYLINNPTQKNLEETNTSSELPEHNSNEDNSNDNINQTSNNNGNANNYDRNEDNDNNDIKNHDENDMFGNNDEKFL